MRALLKDLIWVGCFAIAMTGCVAVPIATMFAIVAVLDTPQINAEMAIPLVLLAGSFVFFLSLGFAYVLRRNHRMRERGVPLCTKSERELDDETQLMQELHQHSIRMEKRLESLETILLGRTETRENSWR